MEDRVPASVIMVGDNFQWINNRGLLRDSSGIITNGSLHPSIRRTLIGCIFRCSIQGDNLWTRLYQDLGWDSTGAWWMSMESMRTTPYNTLTKCVEEWAIAWIKSQEAG
ncbi:MAG: hypothetical protein IPI30_04400 [Saprospiraceae bacterium]|nr:hypothetical protein [Candidatus Vicinibacter affinis]